MIMHPFFCYFFRRYKPAPLELLCFLCQMGLVTPLFPFPRAFTNVCTKTMAIYHFLYQGREEESEVKTQWHC